MEVSNQLPGTLVVGVIVEADVAGETLVVAVVGEVTGCARLSKGVANNRHKPAMQALCARLEINAMAVVAVTQRAR
jgi:hypothetical protein